MTQGQKTFVTIFPSYRDYHFFKDPGQIPYRMSQRGYSASVVLYNDGTPLLKQTEKYIRVNRIPGGFLSRKFNAGILIYLLRNSRDIDILNLFHFTWSSLLFASVYKLLHRKGFVYLKMDSSHYAGTYSWEAIFDKSLTAETGAEYRRSLRGRVKGRIIRKHLVKNVDLWSVEDDHTRENYLSRFDFMRGRLIKVTNGYPSDIVTSDDVRAYHNKENIILTVGRLGTFQKGTELLLEGFGKIADRCSFDLHLAGSVEPAFKEYTDRFFEQYPNLRERVIFHGELSQPELVDLYNRAKIFCMPSRFEGMAIVFPEAMFFRMATVTSGFVSPAGVIKENRLGMIIDELTGENVASALLFMTGQEEEAGVMADNARIFALKEFNWEEIAEDLDRELITRS